MANKGKHRLFHNAASQVLHKAHTEEHPSLKQSKAEQQMMLACSPKRLLPLLSLSISSKQKNLPMVSLPQTPYSFVVTEQPPLVSDDPNHVVLR
jgi:hypothetical protein